MKIKPAGKTGMTVLVLTMLLLCTGGYAYGDAYGQAEGWGGSAGDVPMPSGVELIDIWHGGNQQGGGNGGNQQGGGDDGGNTGGGNAVDTDAGGVSIETQHKIDAYYLNDQANKAYSTSKWPEAIRLYEQALALSPDDSVIRQNLKNAKDALEKEKRQKEYEAERHKRELEAQQKAESEKREFERNKQEVLKAIGTHTGVSAKTVSAGQVPTGFGYGTMPASLQKVGGLTLEEWREAQECQRKVDELYEKGFLSKEESELYDRLLLKRNAFWNRAISVPGLTAEERERLRLKLHSGDLLNEVAPGIPPESLKPKKNPPPKVKDTVLTTLVSKFYVDKSQQFIEMKGQDHVVFVHGEEAGGHYENFLAIAKVFMKGDSSKKISEGMDFIIGKAWGPRASFAVEGGRQYANVEDKAMARFIEDCSAAAGVKIDVKEWMDNMKRENKTVHKNGMEWLGLRNE